MTGKPPHLIAAEVWMEMQGLNGYEPTRVIAIEDSYCWYVYYEIAEGLLELEISWDGSWSVHHALSPNR